MRVIATIMYEQTFKSGVTDALAKRAEIAFRIAVAKAIDEHARLGFPVYIWRDGRVVELSPDEVLHKSPASDGK